MPKYVIEITRERKNDTVDVVDRIEITLEKGKRIDDLVRDLMAFLSEREDVDRLDLV